MSIFALAKIISKTGKDAEFGEEKSPSIVSLDFLAYFGSLPFEILNEPVAKAPGSDFGSLMRKAVLVLFVLIFSANAFSQNVATGFDLSNYGVRIEPDRRLIVVLATIEMAGTPEARVINTPLSGSGKKFRGQLQTDLANMPADLRQKITVFMTQHKKRFPDKTDAQIVAPFISMAYTLSEVPELADPVITSDLPGDLLDVLDFAPLVREFHRRSGVSAKLDEYVKAYQRASEGTLRNSTRETVSELLNYLHTRPQTIYAERIKTETQKSKSKKTTLQQVEIRERERSFYIVPEMLAPVGDINFLNIRDDYYIVLPPESDISYSDVRRGFLRFVIDPIVLNNAKDISTMRDGIKTLLDDRRKTNASVSPDVYIAVSRSLVAAADARQLEYLKSQIATEQARQKIVRMKTDTEKRAVSAELDSFKKGLADETALQLSEDYEKGSVLAFYFADQLKGLEDSGFDIASSMREMILSLDATKEASRLEQFADARKRAVAAREERKKNPVKPAVTENPVTAKLLDIQKTIAAKDYASANTELKELLRSNPSEPRIYYNIGRMASLEAEEITEPDAQSSKLLEAKTAYENVLRLGANQTIDSTLFSLTYVALAKIYEFYDNPGYAMKIYDAAIKVGDVPNGAYKEAIAAKQRLLKDQ